MVSLAEACAMLGIGCALGNDLCRAGRLPGASRDARGAWVVSVRAILDTLADLPRQIREARQGKFWPPDSADEEGMARWQFHIRLMSTATRRRGSAGTREGGL
jgi:hypothetical protein